MRGFASALGPPSLRSSAKAQVGYHCGRVRASRECIQTHISTHFVHGCGDELILRDKSFLRPCLSRWRSSKSCARLSLCVPYGVRRPGMSGSAGFWITRLASGGVPSFLCLECSSSHPPFRQGPRAHSLRRLPPFSSPVFFRRFHSLRNDVLSPSIGYYLLDESVLISFKCELARPRDAFCCDKRQRELGLRRRRAGPHSF